MKILLCNSDVTNVKNRHYVVLDLGTTGVKAFVYSSDFHCMARAYKKLRTYEPKRGWREQNPADYIRAAHHTIDRVISQSRVPVNAIVAMGLTNQRETIVAWNKKTGKALYPAIVWSDSRTRAWCRSHKTQEKMVRKKTGLTVDPYFSASKIAWLFENVPSISDAYHKDVLAIGTIDSWCMANMLEQSPYYTDYTNASRTLLFNIHKKKWDPSLFDIFSISGNSMPEVKPSQYFYGNVKKEFAWKPIPLMAVVGDQQASLTAAGMKRGTTKITFGTGTFLMQTLGSKATYVPNFFTTLTPSSYGVQFALEAKIAESGVVISGLLHDDHRRHAYYKKLLATLQSAISNLPIVPSELVLDGGATQDPMLVEMVEKIIGIPVRIHTQFDGTALGAAQLTQYSYETFFELSS